MDREDYMSLIKSVHEKYPKLAEDTPDWTAIMVKMALNKVLEEVKEIFITYDKYVKGLEDENAGIAPLAIGHGWRSSKVELGKKLRTEIKDLKQKWIPKTIAPEVEKEQKKR